MAMLTLKKYQEDALASLAAFLNDTRKKPLAEAFRLALAAQNRIEPYQSVFGDAVPSVCLRVPTGGGKTLLAAHAVALAGKVILDTDAPVALW